MPFGDTDSFYNIEHPDMYGWMNENTQYLDLSKYTREDMRSDENKKTRLFKTMNSMAV